MREMGGSWSENLEEPQQKKIEATLSRFLMGSCRS